MMIILTKRVENEKKLKKFQKNLSQTPRKMSTTVAAANTRNRLPPTYCTVLSDTTLDSAAPPERVLAWTAGHQAQGRLRV